MRPRTSARRSGRSWQVGAPEGDDAGVGVGAREDGEAVGPQAGAEDGARGVAPRRRRCCAGGSRRSVAVTPLTGQPQRSSPPAAVTSAASRRQTAPKSTIPVPGRCSAAMPAACGSIARSPAASRRRTPGTPLAARPALELVERGQLVAAQRDDQLADPPHVDRVGLAVGVHPRGALDAQPRLQRARRVVDPAVDDAGVVRALVRRGRRLALERRARARPGAARGSRARRRARGCPRRRRSCRGGRRPSRRKCPQRAANQRHARGRDLLVRNISRERRWFRPAFADCPDPKTPYEREPPPATP